MALSKQQRRQQVRDLIADGVFDASAEDRLMALTDNQLVALGDAEALDSIVDMVANSAEEDDELPDDDDDEETESEVDDAEDDDSDDDDEEEEEDDEEDDTEEEPTKPTGNSKGKKDMAGKTLTGCSDEELMAEMDKRRKMKKDKMVGNKKRTNRRPTSNRNHAPELSEDEWMARAPKRLQRMVANSARVEDELRAKYIDIITTNGSNTFSDDELEATDIDTLERMAALAGNSRSTDYGGRLARGFATNSSATPEEPLGLPDLEFDDK